MVRRERYGYPAAFAEVGECAKRERLRTPFLYVSGLFDAINMFAFIEYISEFLYHCHDISCHNIKLVFI